MDIAIIGAGHIGSTLALGFARKGHRIYLGVKDPVAIQSNTLLNQYANITAHPVKEAVSLAGLLILCVPARAVTQVCGELGRVADKIILETTNGSIGTDQYPDAVRAIKAITGSADVAKCFNGTGFENLADPMYEGQALDMFMAGSSSKAKEKAHQLALELGFAQCHDLGDDSKITLLEQVAFLWMTLAFGTKLGRQMGFKILTR